MIHPPTALAGSVLVLAAGLGDSLQLVGIAIALGVGLAVGRVKRKDAAIHDLERALDAKQERLDETKVALEGAQKRADDEHLRVRELERVNAKLEEAVRLYTAEGALGQIKEILAQALVDGAERAAKMDERQERVEKAIIGAVEAQGELILKNTELVSRLLQHVGERTGGLWNALGDSDAHDPHQPHEPQQ